MSGISGLIVLVSQQGFWFGGDTGTISFELANASTPAVLSWQLRFGEFCLAEEAIQLNGPITTLSLEMQPVRSMTVFHFHYQLRDKQSGLDLGEGQIEIYCYPRNLLSGLDRALRNKRVIVLDRERTLSNVLRSAGVQVRTIQYESELQLARPDLLIVAPDQIQPTLFSQSILWEQVAGGARAVVFQQSAVATLAGYEVRSAATNADWQWREGHPLLDGVTPEVRGSLLGSATDLHPIVLSDIEPRHAVVHWPGAVADDDPAQIRALLASMPLERGWLILCQLPTLDWERDPRSQLLLYNTLYHLITVDRAATEPALSLIGDRP